MKHKLSFEQSKLTNIGSRPIWNNNVIPSLMTISLLHNFWKKTKRKRKICYVRVGLLSVRWSTCQEYSSVFFCVLVFYVFFFSYRFLPPDFLTLILLYVRFLSQSLWLPTPPLLTTLSSNILMTKSANSSSPFGVIVIPPITTFSIGQYCWHFTWQKLFKKKKKRKEKKKSHFLLRPCWRHVHYLLLNSYIQFAFVYYNQHNGWLRRGKGS